LASVVGTPILETGTLDVPGNGMSDWFHAFGISVEGNTAIDPAGISRTSTAVCITSGIQGSHVNKDGKVFSNTHFLNGIFAVNQNYGGFNRGTSFKFYADDFITASNTLAFFFYNVPSNHNRKYTFGSSSIIGNWYDYYSMPIFWPANWSLPGFGQAHFISELADVDQIGIWISRSNF
jgi:hypothetical protein